MANEGSTKPEMTLADSYREVLKERDELSASLARVRGLLQRQSNKPKGSWNAEDYRRSADVHQVAEEIIKRVVGSTLALAHIRQVSVLDDCPEEAVFVADGLAVALGEDTGCNDPEDLTAENCELLFVEEELREILKRAGAGLGDALEPPNFPQSSSLVPQGPESADIGKLDAADKSGKVNRVEEGSDEEYARYEQYLYGYKAHEAGHNMMTFSGWTREERKLGGAETGGEKA